LRKHADTKDLAMSDMELGYWMLMEMMLRAVSIICAGESQGNARPGFMLMDIKTISAKL
jgi:hypothetical protein